MKPSYKEKIFTLSADLFGKKKGLTIVRSKRVCRLGNGKSKSINCFIIIAEIDFAYLRQFTGNVSWW